jgi:fructose-1,6-bisphosphatase
MTHPEIKVLCVTQLMKFIYFSEDSPRSRLLIFFCFMLRYLQIPPKGKIYSVNEGNAKNWDTPTAKYVMAML